MLGKIRLSATEAGICLWLKATKEPDVHALVSEYVK